MEPGDTADVRMALLYFPERCGRSRRIPTSPERLDHPHRPRGIVLRERHATRDGKQKQQESHAAPRILQVSTLETA